jgi:hypothetical protein
MMKKIVLSAVLLVCSLTWAFAADFNGRWEGTVTGPDGNEMKLAMVLKADGEKLTGTIESPMGEMSIVDGKIKGEDCTFVVEMGDNKYAHTGKISGDTLTIKVSIPDGPGDFEYTLKRVSGK